ncbi:MAG: resuscitation-promoting factor RpfB [Actinomycetota bacterium]|jgi:hypothetical protein|nr:resuscitation-promoting factor RpfB [Actinomycetota bacterium]
MDRLKRPLLAVFMFVGASIVPAHPPHVAVAAAAASKDRTAVTLSPFDSATIQLAVAERTPHIQVSRSEPAPRVRIRPVSVTPKPRPARVAPTGDIWGRLAACESGGNTRAVGGGGRYFGAFQFTLGSWQRAGQTGNPIDYPYEVQLTAAQRLQSMSGWGQWPVCARRLGLY